MSLGHFKAFLPIVLSLMAILLWLSNGGSRSSVTERQPASVVRVSSPFAQISIAPTQRPAVSAVPKAVETGEPRAVEPKPSSYIPSPTPVSVVAAPSANFDIAGSIPPNETRRFPVDIEKWPVYPEGGYKWFQEKCFGRQCTLITGHSHTQLMSYAFCRMLGRDGKRCSKIPPIRWDPAKDGIQPWAPDRTEEDAKNGYYYRQSMDPYWTFEGKAKHSRTFSRSYHFIIASAAIWDLHYRNTSPWDLYLRTKASMKRMTDLLYEKPLEDGKLGGVNKIVVYLLHHHRKPSWPSRIPCTTEDRVLAYRRAVELACAEVAETLPPTKKILIFDIYDWSKALPAEAYNEDGHHLKWGLIQDLVYALLRHPLVQLPGCGQGVLPGLENAVRPLKPIGELDKDGLRTMAWPSRPSCETHLLKTRAKFHTSAWPDYLRPGWKSRWDTFRADMAEYVIQNKYDTNSLNLAQKAQIVHELCKGDANVVGNGPAQTCFKSIGLNENATDWDDAPKPDVEFTKQYFSSKNALPSCLCKDAGSIAPSLQAELNDVLTGFDVTAFCRKRILQVRGFFLQPEFTGGDCGKVRLGSELEKFVRGQ